MTDTGHASAGDQLADCADPDRTGYLRGRDPEVRILRDAIVAPKVPGVSYETDTQWGLYESDGRLCEAASYRRGEGWGRLGQADSTALTPAAYLPDQLYVYAGPCHIHYGHMLASTLARLWTAISPRQGVKFLFHGDATPRHWFSFPHFREVMSGLSLSPDDFLCPTQPVRVGQIVVPDAAFEELSHAHLAFGHMGTRMGDAILKHTPVAAGEGLVYLSKSKLASGIWNIENEAEFESHLEAAGVRVLHPETLSISQQIEALEGASTILGLAGSALHTALLARRALRIRALCTGEGVVRNYRLIDMLKTTDARYFHFRNIEVLEPNARFTARFRIRDPKASAREYLQRSLDS